MDTSIIIAVIGCNGLWTLILYLVQRHDRKKNPESRLLLGMAHDRIVFLCEKACERGWTTSGEMDNITQIYQPYVQLGGNGTGKNMYERYIKLPMKKDGE